MRRHFTRIGLGALASVAVLALVISSKERTLGAKAVEALRPLLRTELEVGGAAISIWRDFPYLRVGLEDVRLGGFPEGEFLTAAAVTSRLSWGDLLFGDDWVFNTIRLHDASLRIHRDSERRGNWLVLAPGDSTGASRRDIAFQLSRIQLDDVRIQYIDDATATRAELLVAEGTLAGRFGSTQYTLTGQLDGHSRFLSLGDLAYLEDVGLGADFNLDIDLAANSYHFGKSTIQVDGMPIDVAGTFAFEAASTLYDLQLHTTEGELGALLKSLPHQWVTPTIRSMKTQGAFALEGTIAGRHDTYNNPEVRFGGSLRNGSLLVPALGKKASNVSFRLSYTNGDERPGMKNSQLVLANLLAQLDGQPLSGNFAWTDFDDPFFDIDLSGTMPLNWFDELWTDGDFAGDLSIRNLNIRGRQRHLAEGRYGSQVTTRGGFQLDGAAVIYHGDRFDVDALSIELRGADLAIRKGFVEGHGDRLATDLEVRNLVAYLLGGDSERLHISGALAVPSLDLAAWVGSVVKGQAATQAAGGAAAAGDQALLPGITADVRLSAARVTYGAVVAERFGGSCHLEASRLRLDGEAYAMEGHWEVDGHVDLKTRMRLGAKLACSEVNITELFEQTDNVGQEVVQAKHIQGQMTTRAYVEAGWKADGTFDADQLHIWANVGLTDGELRDFEMLQALSKFVRSAELSHIRFIDTENWIEVVGEQVYLPAMFIQSTATNFTVAGEHSFAQDIDYSVRLNGAQVLLQKLFGKRQGTDFVPDRRQGWVKTGVSIAGTLVRDDYEVKLDGPKVRRHFRHSQVRKSAIREKLAALFGRESLIDDYDDEGDRRRHLPAEFKARTEAVATLDPEVEPEAAVEEPSGKTRPERRFVIGSAGPQEVSRPTLVVDPETYLEFEDDHAARESSRPNARRAGSGGTAAKPVSAARPFQGLFGPKPAATSDRPVRERPTFSPSAPPKSPPPSEEFLEGFDGPQE